MYAGSALLPTMTSIHRDMDAPELKRDALVVRHNKLIESKHTLSLYERRFMLWLISKINRKDDKFQTYSLSVNELFDISGLKRSDERYRLAVEMQKSLQTKYVGIKDEASKTYTTFNWFQRIKYYWGEGRIEAQIHEDMRPYLLELKEQYTVIALEYALLLRSGYSHRVYDLLKQYQSVGNRTISLPDLRDMLEIKKHEYPRYADFRHRVLEVAQREINEKTDIAFEFEPVKDSRKIVAIFLRIRTTKPTVTLENPEETDERTRAAFQALIRHGVAEKTARALIADYDLERIKWHVAAYEKRKKSGKADGIGWLVEGIKSDYRPQASIFEREEAEKRRKAQAERARREALDAEIEGLKQACDEHNRKSGTALLASLPEAEREAMRGELLTRYGDTPLFGDRIRREGAESPLVLLMYLGLIHKKYPEKVMSYLEYAKKHKASKEAIKDLRT
jgi:plasmid replication initiation protein